MRSMETPVLPISEIVRPSSRIGQISMPLYARKAMYSPAVSLPLMQKRTPMTISNSNCRPDSTSDAHQKNASEWAIFTHSDV